MVGKDSRSRKMPEYLIHFSGWKRSWDRCVAEELILPNTPENKKLKKKLEAEAAQKLLQTSRSKKRKVPAILKESLDRKLRGSSRKEQSISGSSSSEEESDSSQSESSERPGDFSDEEDSDDEPQEVATDYNISIPQILRTILEDDYYNITSKKKLLHLPCTPDVVDILEAYLKQYAAKLTGTAARPAKGNSLRQPPLDTSEIEARFSLCKEAMDGLRIMFSYTLSNLLLYNEEQSQLKLLTAFCRPIRISSPVPSRQTNEPTSQNDASLLNIAPDVATTVKCRSRKSLRGNSDLKGSTSSPQRKRSASPAEKRTLRSGEPHSIWSSPPAKSTQDDSDTDNLPLAVAIMGRTPRRRTASTCSVASSVSVTTTTSEAALSVVTSKFDCTILPTEFLEEDPSSPALLYGAYHFLRLFVKLPMLLQKMSITKRKASYLENFVNGLLQYLATRQEELFPPSAYGDAEQIMSELEKHRTGNE